MWGAIYRLEAEGIVEVVPRLGVYLIKYDPNRAIEIYVAREALEGMTARLAAERITQAEISALQASIDQQREHLRMHELDKYYAAALEFHEEIIRIAASSTLERLLRSIFAQIKAMRVQRNYMPMHLPQSCDDHENLLEALQRRDPDLAEFGFQCASHRTRQCRPVKLVRHADQQGMDDQRVLRHYRSHVLQRDGSYCSPQPPRT